jgi:predicted SAM-dependent methyltransferase
MIIYIKKFLKFALVKIIVLLRKFDVYMFLSRNDKILFQCNLRGVGLEIGPSFSPIVSKKNGFNVEILDHANKEELKEKYKNHSVNIDNIEDVDFVWSGERLEELTGKNNYYDYIVASHVIEHTPDLVSFLQQCEIMLKNDGVLCLAIPDRRYCFDIFRPSSTPGDVIQAYLEKRNKHTLGAIWDNFSMITKKGSELAWKKWHMGKYELINGNIDEAMVKISDAKNKNEYIDVHNWRFTPSSFKLIMHDIIALGYVNFIERNYFKTKGCEFIIQLKKVDFIVNNDSNNIRLKLLIGMLKESSDI